MPSLSDTISRLAALKDAGARVARPAGRLRDLARFGSNPGDLRAKVHVPDGIGDKPPLVVVLHGCTQTADGYDIGSGWSQLADRHGFVLLFPEQQRQNNANLCFNWVAPGDNRRGRGEALSIREMIATMVDDHAVDPARMFVTGLSAGGAMAAVMLATYPEIFAGGAVIAGLPYGCAGSVPEAFDRMRGHGLPGEAALAGLVRGASRHTGAWPTLSVWHGSGDATVDPINAAALVGQWRDLHGLAAAPTRREVIDGYPRRLWCDAGGRAVIEAFSITGMGHGTPLDTVGPDGCGAAGAYMLEVSISSTRHIAAFWGLSGDDRRAAAAAPVAGDRALPVPRSIRPDRIPRPGAAGGDHGRSAGGVGKVIEDALRAAGLMRRP